MVVGRGDGRTNERPGTDHAISWAIKGLKKNCTRWCRQTDRHGDSMTESAHWGRFSENAKYLRPISQIMVQSFDPTLLIKKKSISVRIKDPETAWGF